MLGFALAAMLAAAPSAKGRSLRAPDLSELYLQHAASIVFVRATYNDGASVNSGTGIVLDGGRILTACHVLRHGPDDATEADAFEVIVGRFDAASGTVQASMRLPAKVLRCDRERDLAVLRVQTKLPLPPALRLATAKPEPGTPAAALGHSWRGLPWTVHRCQVAGTGDADHDATSSLTRVDFTLPDPRKQPDAGIQRLEVDCDSHPMSGSALLDADGRILGLRQFVRFDPRETSRTEYSFYIAAREIQAFLDE